MNNSIFTIQPYKYQGQWVFDDERVGLVREAFVAGADVAMDKMTSIMRIKDADKGFILLFSKNKFPCSQFKFVWDRPESGGNWYRSEELELEGWLCSALYLFYKIAPKEIYIQVKAKE